MSGFPENLTVGKFWLWRKSKYHRNYVRKRMKISIKFKNLKVIDSYYYNDLIDYVFMLIFGGFYPTDFL